MDTEFYKTFRISRMDKVKIINESNQSVKLSYNNPSDYVTIKNKDSWIWKDERFKFQGGRPFHIKCEKPVYIDANKEKIGQYTIRSRSAKDFRSTANARCQVCGG